VGAAHASRSRQRSARALYSHMMKYYSIHSDPGGDVFAIAVDDDAEDGSVVYLLVRTIRRALVYLGKLSGAALARHATVWDPASHLRAGVARRQFRPASGDVLLQDAAWLSLGSIRLSRWCSPSNLQYG